MSVADFFALGTVRVRRIAFRSEAHRATLMEDVERMDTSWKEVNCCFALAGSYSIMPTKINWRHVGHVVLGCLLLGVLLEIAGRISHWPLNPIPSLAAGVFAIVVHGYVGAGSRYVMIFGFLYWGLFGFLLSPWLQSEKKEWTMVIIIALMVHVMFSALALVPLFVLNINR